MRRGLPCRRRTIACCATLVACCISSQCYLRVATGSTTHDQHKAMEAQTGAAASSSASLVQRRLLVLEGHAGIPTSSAVSSVKRRWMALAAAVLCSPSSVDALIQPTAKDRESLKSAVEVLKELQARWPEFQKLGPEKTGDEMMQAFTGSFYKKFGMIIPGGRSLGIDIEDRTVSNINDEGMGWTLGDVIESVNGEEPKDEEGLVSLVAKKKKEGKELTFVAKRLMESPFVRLNRAFTNLYVLVDAEIEIPEPDTMSDEFQSLKNFVGLYKDGFGDDLSALKAKLDAFVKNSDLYLASLPAAK